MAVAQIKIKQATLNQLRTFAAASTVTSPSFTKQICVAVIWIVWVCALKALDRDVVTMNERVCEASQYGSRSKPFMSFMVVVLS